MGAGKASKKVWVFQNPDRFQRGKVVQGRGVATVEGIANKKKPGAKKLTFDLSI